MNDEVCRTFRVTRHTSFNLPVGFSPLERKVVLVRFCRRSRCRCRSRYWSRRCRCCLLCVSGAFYPPCTHVGIPSACVFPGRNVEGHPYCLSLGETCKFGHLVSSPYVETYIVGILSVHIFKDKLLFLPLASLGHALLHIELSDDFSCKIHMYPVVFRPERAVCVVVYVTLPLFLQPLPELLESLSQA